MSISWSSKDSELLLSCGKDNRTLCWNPTTGDVIGEVSMPLENDLSHPSVPCQSKLGV